MKQQLLKPLALVLSMYLAPLALVTLALSSPTYANGQESELPTEITETSATPSQNVNADVNTTQIDDQKLLVWGVYKSEDASDNEIIEVNLGMDQLKDVIEEIATEDEYPAHTSVNKDGLSLMVAAEEDAVNVLGKIITTLTETEYSDLDESEQEAILDALKEIEGGIDIDLSSNMGLGETLLGVIAIISIFGSPFIILGLVMFYKHRKRRQRDALITKFLDAGKDIPVEVIQGFSGTDEPKGNLQRGIMLTGIGIGLYLFFGMYLSWNFASIALIPLFIGIARLLMWKLGDQKTSEHKAD
ncbi:MAG: DUF6249 domain-containing protein [Porticoccaceae bacterium]|nr:DUF6249 domain-containing protein [Porticoccaceae bacterium]